MTAKIFRIKGSFSKKGKPQTFTKEIPALSQDRALDKLYSLLGSNHKVKRSRIEIINVEEVQEK